MTTRLAAKQARVNRELQERSNRNNVRRLQVEAQTLVVIQQETELRRLERNMEEHRQQLNRDLNRDLLGGAVSLQAALLYYEGRVIEAALKLNGHSVTNAAAALGESHQQLSYVIKRRQPHLLALRKTVIKRKKRS